MQQKGSDHTNWMAYACSLAETAEALDEVPVGAIVLSPDNKIIGTGFNQRERLNQPGAHAEAIAIQEAATFLKSWRLVGCRLYTTLEPCLMCAGTIVQARLNEVVYGASDPKGGAMGSLYKVQEDQRLNHQPKVTSGILETECSNLLKRYFKAKRNP